MAELKARTQQAEKMAFSRGMMQLTFQLFGFQAAAEALYAIPLELPAVEVPVVVVMAEAAGRPELLDQPTPEVAEVAEMVGMRLARR